MNVYTMNSQLNRLIERFYEFYHDTNRRLDSLEKWRKACSGANTYCDETGTLLKQVEELERRLEVLEPKVTFVVDSEGKPVRRASEQEIEAIRQSQATARALKNQQEAIDQFYRVCTERDTLQSKFDTVNLEFAKLCRDHQGLANSLRAVSTERDTLQSKLDEIKNAISTEGYYPAAAIRRILDK